MHESLLMNQILLSFNLLMFVVCGFRENIYVLVVSVVLSSLYDSITTVIIMIIIFLLVVMFIVFLLNVEHLLLLLLLFLL